MPPFVSPSQRCVGCTARMAACVSGPTPAPVLRAGWADSVRNVSIRQTFFTTQELAYRKVFADLLASISCHPSTPFGTQREFRDSRNNKGLSVCSQTKHCLFWYLVSFSISSGVEKQQCCCAIQPDRAAGMALNSVLLNITDLSSLQCL